MSTLHLDPSYPYQISGNLLALWKPRGRGRDDLAESLVAAINVCTDEACLCTDAYLNVWLIDDRATKVTREGSRVSMEWTRREDPRPRPERSARLKLDMTTGAIQLRGGDALPEDLQSYFEAPLSYWVLDSLWLLWRALRAAQEIDWYPQALKNWEADEYLSMALAYPNSRPDRYWVKGKLYQLDPMIPIDDDEIEEVALSVIKVSEDDLRQMEEVGAITPSCTKIGSGEKLSGFEGFE